MAALLSEYPKLLLSIRILCRNTGNAVPIPSYLMTICTYFLKGRCRYGDTCRYEHVYPPGHHEGKDPRNNYDNGHSETRTNAHRNSRRWYGAAVWPLSAVSNSNNPTAGNDVQDDTSQEELRAQAYLSSNNGKFHNASEHELTLLRKHQSATSATLLSDTFAQSLPGGTHTGDGFFANKPAPNSMFITDQNQGFAGNKDSGFTTIGQSANGFGKTQDPFSNTNTSNSIHGAFVAGTSSFGGNANGATSQFGQLGSGVPLEPGPANLAFAPTQVLPRKKVETDLTPLQRNEFKSDHFTMGNVPEVAPPPEFYCF